MEFNADVEIVGDDAVRVRLFAGTKLWSDAELEDPELGHLRYLMDNKECLNDRGGFEYNARRYLQLVDELVADELQCLVDRDDVVMATLDLCVIVLVPLFLLFATYNLWLLAGYCGGAALTLTVSDMVAIRRYAALDRFHDRLDATFEARLSEFVRKEWKQPCHCSGRRWEQENQGCTLLMPQPIQEGSGNASATKQ